MWTDNNDGEKPFLMECNNATEEINKVLDFIQEKKKNGLNYRDMAILYRNRAIGKQFQSELHSRNIRFGMNGVPSFYHRPEVRDIISYLGFLLNPDDEYYFLKIINVPDRGLDSQFITLLKNTAKENKISLFAASNWILENEIPLEPNKKKHLSKFLSMTQKMKQHLNKDSIGDLIEVVIKYSGYQRHLSIKSEKTKNFYEVCLKDLKRALDETTHDVLLDDQSDEESEFSSSSQNMSLAGTLTTNLLRLKQEAITFAQQYTHQQTIQANQQPTQTNQNIGFVKASSIACDTSGYSYHSYYIEMLFGTCWTY
eukprot:TRINITY_DN18667_c0_g1_i2.p1 TRINITY_DN18667_c0_g1~~TRINITY_DN18667_c0_g1_i2.p1  ORF type:complete len:312 (-),score=88.92 TRINITY_DN18667_c0_g1_i2:720-1655(-)